MEALREYLNSLPRTEQDAFAKKCNTSVGYLRKAISLKQSLRVPLLIDIERESHGKVRCEQMRSDVDWVQLRTGARHRKLAV